MRPPQLQPEQYTEGILELAIPGGNSIDFMLYQKITTEPSTLDELICALVRESKGRIPLKIVKDLFEVLPKVTAQFFVEFREGRITFHDLKLESLGLDHTKFLTSAKILELAFPDDDL